MKGLFISYRRSDSAGHAGRLYDRLAAHYGPEKIFRDIEDIDFGDDFVAAIRKAFDACDAFLLVIGPNWLDIQDAEGRRRLEDPDDVVSLEIVTALEHPDMRVVPVLVHGARMPGKKDLPEHLSALAQRNAIEIRDTSFDGDVDRLVRFLGGSRIRRKKVLLATAGVSVLVLAAVLLSWFALVEPALAADITLYTGGGQLQGAPEGEVVALVMPPDEPAPELERAGETDLYQVSYTFERTAARSVNVVPVLPYRDLMLQGGPVRGSSGWIDWDWPRLSVKVVNTSSRAVQLSELALRVDQSEVDREPLVLIEDRHTFDLRNFGMFNYGWGEAVGMEARIGIVEEQQCRDHEWRDVPLERVAAEDWSLSPTHYEGVVRPATRGSPGMHALLDVTDYVPPELAVDPEVVFEDRFACLFGVLDYRNERGDARSLRFSTMIRLAGPMVLPAVPPSEEYFVFLEAGKSGYTKSVPMAFEVPAGKSEHFLLRVGTDKSASFDITAVLRAVGGEQVPTVRLQLEILTPVYDPYSLRDPSKRR